MSEIIGVEIHISGIVQGVGFRPFVYSLATRLALPGWVRNTSAGVDIRLDGSEPVVNEFLKALQTETPPLAQIDALDIRYCPPTGFSTFEIIHSQPIEGSFIPISPDMSICSDCLKELFDPHDRRYLYPFINCTNCGPRFTIIEDIPYDRAKTTMKGFPMCPDCTSEYQNPLDRRFHAQPVACPTCGPQVWLEDCSGTILAEGKEALSTTQEFLTKGKILAIKGLGGFHLACDAQNPAAVKELRQRKLRVDKPFALMMPNLEVINEHCHLNATEGSLLDSRQRPIVLLWRRAGSNIALEVAPRQNTLGVILPYTPLHYLLFSHQLHNNIPPFQALVMTSGNLKEEPIASDNDDARQRLGPLCDAFLMHNRPIHIRCDDSVMRIFGNPVDEKPVKNGQKKIDEYAFPIRRSRGYSPFPVQLPWLAPPILATGAELKNTFCITRDNYAFLSHHIGDLENFETLRSFEDGVRHFENLFRLKLQAIAFDLHPDYLATHYALVRCAREQLPMYVVQHHHAHIAACMAENGLPGETKVIGVAFDGTGYGLDGAIWGGEIFLAEYMDFQRPYHLAYVPLPGGDKAVREPWRMALSWLEYAGISWSEELHPVKFVLDETRDGTIRLEALRNQIRSRLNSPLTSSVGRLFDAVASLLGIRQQVNYEAQAAIELEACADTTEKDHYPFALTPSAHENGPLQFDPSPIMEAICQDLRDGIRVEKISARFHNSLAVMITMVGEKLRDATGIKDIALSGGVWQNLTLLKITLEMLDKAGFTIYIHHQIPTNDGGLALGQAAVASRRMVIGKGG